MAWLVLAPALGAAPESPVCPAIDAPAPVSAGVRAFVDPTTGKLREPTADELRRIAEERLARRAAAPRTFEVVTHPDGMKTVDLGDAFLFDVRATTDPDGTLRLVCVPRSPAAPAAVK